MLMRVALGLGVRVLMDVPVAFVAMPVKMAATDESCDKGYSQDNHGDTDGELQ